MLLLTKEDLIRIFENELDFNSDRQNNHRHDKRDKHLLLRGVFGLVGLHNFGDGNEQHFVVKLIERKGVKMSENAPVREMADLADKPCGVFECYGAFGVGYHRFCNRRGIGHESQIYFVSF
jgi:hypothetical protein